MAVTTLGLILGGLGVAQTALSVIGDRKAAKAARKQGEFEGSILDEQADFALEAGAQAESRSRAGSRGLTGAQRAAQAASGINVDTGSAADVVANDLALGEMDALTIRQNAARESYGFRQQAELARMGGRNTAASYNNRSAGTLLSGAAQLYGVYKSLGQSSGSSTPRRAVDNSGGYGQR